MESLVRVLAGVPPLAWIGGALAAAAAAAAVAALVSDRRFLRLLREAAEAPSSAPCRPMGGAARFLRERQVIRRARSGFRGSPGPFPDLPRRMGYADLWLAALARVPSRRAMAQTLEFLPDIGLFACFRAALQSRPRAAELIAWMGGDRGAFALRRIALAGPGRDFDGAAARLFLDGMMDEVRELLGDQEWAVRVFALRVILGDADERSAKGVAACLHDPHPLVRRLAAERGRSDDRFGWYGELYRLLAGDPSLEVRRAAKARILEEYRDLYVPVIKDLEPDGVLHVLGLLDPEDGEDEKLAFAYLADGDEEQRLCAAEYLDARGSLERVLAGVDPADEGEFERRLALLSAAARLHACGFLACIDRLEGPGPFLLAARLLAETGDRERIGPLARRWFGLMGDGPHGALELRVYRAVLEAIRTRGTQDAYAAVSAELQARRRSPALAALILASLDDRSAPAVYERLKALFLDADFACREELRAALLRLDRDGVVPLVLSAVGADRASLPRAVRRDALLLMAELRLGGALQRMIEALPLLSADETAEFAAALSGWDAKSLERQLRRILDGVDAPSRAAALSVIPAAGAKAFLPDAKAAIRDADPDVRVAAARALCALQEGKALAAGGMDLLRDPVERVRVAAAAALAQTGGAPVAEGLRAALADPNEVDEVKRSLIRGLGQASDGAGLDLLVDELGTRDDFREELLDAVARRRSKRDLGRLVERFKDATGTLKESLAECFRHMGPEGEATLAGLLEEDIAALKPYVVEALEATGYVERRIRELKHRDPRLRREAAAALDRVGSRSAYRGIVQAARDPDPDVRVAVTRALDRLAGPEGAALLAELEADPDARVRKYALWAMERVRAKGL